METVKLNIAQMSFFHGNIIEYHSVDTNKQVGTHEKSLQGVHGRPHWPPDIGPPLAPGYVFWGLLPTFWRDCKAIPAYGLMMSVCQSVCPSVRLSTFW